MIRPIVRDILFLGRKSEQAAAEDIDTANDLLDTLKNNRERCVGMAANMIGELKCIIAFDNMGEYMIMMNPVITKCSGLYETEEVCLSLNGTRKTKRYRTIKVQYRDINFKLHCKSFTDWTAQIIQHEIDHCNGIII